MKKLIVCMVIAMSMYGQTFAQSSVKQLSKYCLVDKSADFFMQNAGTHQTLGIKMTELPDDLSGKTVQTVFFFQSELLHSDVPMNSVANDLWSLISRQLHGEYGKLTLARANYIPTKDPQGILRLAIAKWDKELRKWHVMSVPVVYITSIGKGSRMFDLSL